jgi:hypothetical protein
LSKNAHDASTVSSVVREGNARNCEINIELLVMLMAVKPRKILVFTNFLNFLWVQSMEITVE